jgi:hypothetical protein
LSLGLSTPWLIILNVVGVVWAGIVFLAWFGARVIAARRQHLVDWTSDLRRLNAQEFEWLVTELHRRENYQVEWVGKLNSADGNVDIRASRGGERYLIQCKRWSAKQVDVQDIRAFAGTLTREHLPADGGIFVSLSTFTDRAISEASTLGMQLVDGVLLRERLDRARRTEACRKCGASMILGKSQYGWWLRCSASGCSGKRDLGRDPGRAVELLLDQR